MNPPHPKYPWIWGPSHQPPPAPKNKEPTVKTYHVTPQFGPLAGKTLAIEASVVPTTPGKVKVSLFSYREILPHGYIGEGKTAEQARGGKTDHNGETPEGESDHRVVAFSAWSEEDKLALVKLVHVAAQMTDGIHP